MHEALLSELPLIVIQANSPKSQIDPDMELRFPDLVCLRVLEPLKADYSSDFTMRIMSLHCIGQKYHGQHLQAVLSQHWEFICLSVLRGNLEMTFQVLLLPYPTTITRPNIAARLGT
jgi:hypothetical protein